MGARKRISAVAIGIAVVGGLSAPTAPANAGILGVHSLGLSGYGATVVDDAQKLVFVSGGPNGNSIAVTDSHGWKKGTIDNQPGATGMALNSDGSKLYVAQAQGDAISVIDTKTLKQTAKYATGSQTCPTYLTRTGSNLWYGYGCENDWQGKIGKVDTSAAKPKAEGDQQGDATFDRAPLVISGTRGAGPVVAGQPTLSLSNVHVYDVSGGKLDAGASGEYVGSDLNDASATADGKTLYTASGSRDHVESFATKDLSRSGSYATAAHPNAVAVSSDGGYLAAAPGTVSDRDNGVLVYKAGESTPVRKIDCWASGDVVATRGLAWSADKSRLFIVTQEANDTAPTLHVIAHPTKAGLLPSLITGLTGLGQ